MGFGVLGFRVLGFRVWGLGFRVLGVQGFGVWGLEFGGCFRGFWMFVNCSGFYAEPRFVGLCQVL